MIKRKMSLFVVLVSAIFMISCDGGQEFMTTEGGLKYKLVETNVDQPIAQDGEILSLRMTYGFEDSVMFNTNDIPDNLMPLPMMKSVYPGDFYEMMGMMHLGDSSVFYLDAESFITKTAGASQVPPEMMGKELVFKVRLEKIQSEQELQEEMMAKMEQQRADEAGIIVDYIAEKNIDVEPTETGLYVVVTEEGNGPKPKQGEKVKVHYTGMLLDGTVFDSSVEKGVPFEFSIGGRVIQGWSEGIALLNEGSKATLIIPSSLGYGDRGSGRSIPPFSPLVFDVELIEIVK